MKNFIKSHHPARHAKSFQYAFEGIFHALVNEPNFRVQLAITSVVIALGFHYKITTIEWSVIVLLSGSLLSAELVNTVVEEFVDNLIKEYHQGAKVIKDVSAAFVLINAVTALIILMIIFGPRFAVGF